LRTSHMVAFSSLAAVVVPPAALPGAQFAVQLACRKGGEASECTRQLWRASGNWPVIQPQVVQSVAGQRHTQRPSALAGKGKRAIDSVTSIAVQVDSWETSEELPFGCVESDVGWLPGPVGGSSGRELPPFKGRRPGPSDPSLTAGTGARRIMRAVQFTPAYKERVVALARQHAVAWASAHSTPDAVERSFHASCLEPDHFELWIAVRLRIAAVNSAIAARHLWDKTSPLYDARLDLACPYHVYLWMCRHFSFGEYGEREAGTADTAADDADVAARGATVFDRFRKRRELSDMARAQASKPFNPGQDCGVDDGARPTRHGDGARMRHKAGIHTGRSSHSLNDAATNYFIYWEEATRTTSYGPTGATARWSPATTCTREA